MKKKKFAVLAIFFFLSLIFSARSSWCQLILGQYEDEAPVGTWNILGVTNATSIGLGDTRFAFATDCSASLSNPALILNLEKITFSLHSSFHSTTLFKYSIVNTGVVTTDKNLTLKTYSIDHGGVSVRLKNWAFTLIHALTEIYDRPSIEQNAYYRGSLYYTLNFDQEGHLKTLHFSAARKITEHISVGLGINYVYGHLKKNLEERWLNPDITITDEKSHEFKGYYLNGGIWVGLSKKWAVAAIFRTPFTKKAESQSQYRYQSPQGETDIKIEASAQNKYKQPLVLGIGLSCRFSPRIRMAADLSYFNWSQYKVTYYEEEMERNFKNVIKVGVGIEYLSDLKIFNQRVQLPFRAGLIYDPQPMKVPDSSYISFSFGTGIHWEKFMLDIGAFISKESGSGDSLAARKVCLSLSYLI